MRSKLVAILATAAVFTTTPAYALGSSDLSSMVGSSEGSSEFRPLHKFFEALVSSPASSQGSLDLALSSLPLVGSSELALLGSSTHISPNYPLPTTDEIMEPAIVDKQPEDRQPQLERWTVASPSMKRNVSVLVRTPNDPSQPAPMLYLLDGVDAHYDGGWNTNSTFTDFFSKDNVTLVMPTEARASMWMDWEKEDENLGQPKWETFLTEELPALLEAEQELNYNGKKAIGGISMGAGAAMQIANLNPGTFNAVMGISGCYSTMDPVGRQTVHLTVDSRGGNTENMWGEFGSEAWEEHDVNLDPSGLDDTTVYMSAGTGVLSPEEHKLYFGGGNGTEILTASMLEVGARQCTENLQAVLGDRENVTVDYREEGSHNWVFFRQLIKPGWEAIKPALY